ncbi:MAG: DUF1844 domain-containing protein [Planctomycetes bacterium]|nr:DUF1844 domain-containing protein [Planctomycetota bacterium]
MNENPEEKPKIVVDSDWKAQVEAEREEMRRREAAAQGGQSSSAASAGPQARRSEGAAGKEEQLPPASFALLVTSLATQAMVALGQIPDPFENKPVVRLPLARHHIDMLGVLEEKTKGNLAPDEQSLLTHALADLRMAYVAAKPK